QHHDTTGAKGNPGDDLLATTEGVSREWRYPAPGFCTRPSLGETSDEYMWRDEIFYGAGSEPGIDEIRYGLCGYPEQVATLTVHVNPAVAAEDDAERTDPDVPVQVDVLANDTFNDIQGAGAPNPQTARLSVKEGTLPEGV